jgi:ribonucleoside-diphosphate reductase beta chain
MKDWEDPFSAGTSADHEPVLSVSGPVSFEGSIAVAKDQNVDREERVPLEALRPVRVEDKRVILGDSDVNQLAPFAYPWAWEDFLASQNNHWTPRDIEMAPDIKCYHSDPNFGEEEKHIFDTVFSQLVTFDVVAMRSLSISLIEKITAPEIINYLVLQAAEESIHVWTYQHIIETVGMDQQKAYNRYRTVPELHRKVKMTNDRLAAICDPYIDLTKQENLDLFLMSYAFFACIFEGIWFYNGFTPIFSLQRRGLMTASGEQLQYIMRDEAMHFQFGIKVVNQIMLEQNYRPDPKDIQEMFEEAEEAEWAYAQHILPFPVPGYSAEDHIEQFRYLANLRAQAIGYPEPFKGAECRTPWLDEQVNIRKEKNFFEKKVTEYQQGSALVW